MFDFYERWNPFLRWLLFIPVFFISYFGLHLLNVIGLQRFLGPYDETSFHSFIIYQFYTNVFLVSVSIVFSSFCAPKGRELIAAIYLSIVIILTSLFLAINILSPSMSMWKILFISITLLAGGITGFIGVILENKQKKQNSIDNSI